MWMISFPLKFLKNTVFKSKYKRDVSVFLLSFFAKQITHNWPALYITFYNLVLYWAGLTFTSNIFGRFVVLAQRMESLVQGNARDMVDAAYKKLVSILFVPSFMGSEDQMAILSCCQWSAMCERLHKVASGYVVDRVTIVAWKLYTLLHLGPLNCLYRISTFAPKAHQMSQVFS